MAVPSFFIKSGNSGFLDRQKNLFDILDCAEKEKNSSANSSNEQMEVEVNKSQKRQRRITKQFRGKESLFNEPVDLPLRFRKRNKIPDFQRNPHKWIKYSLGDITQADMSNETNTAAAMLFLRDIESRKSESKIKLENDDNDSKMYLSHLHQFHLPGKSQLGNVNNSLEEIPNTTKSFFKNTKFVMAEYVVGRDKRPVKKIKKEISGERGKEVFLNHIHEYEDE